MKKIFAVLLALLLALTPVLAEENAEAVETPAEETEAVETSEEAAAAEDTEAEPAPETDMNAVIVTYDGGSLTVGDCYSYYQYLTDYYKQMIMSYYGFAPDIDENTDIMIKQNAASNMAQRQLVQIEAAALGIADMITNEQKAGFLSRAEEEFNQYVAYYATEDTTEEDIIALLAESGFTVESIADDYYVQELDDMLYAHYAEGLEVTDEEINTLFDSKVESDRAQYETDPMAFSSAMMEGTQYYWAPEGHRCVKQILIKTSDENQTEMREIYTAMAALAEGEEDAELNERYEKAKAAVIEDCKEKTDAVLAGLAEGKIFEELQEEYCDDPGSLREPIKSIGYCVAERNNGWDDAFKSAAMSLEKIGDVSEPTPGLYGIYIVKYVSDITPGPISIDAVYSELSASALTQKQNDAYSAAIDECFTKYNVAIDVSAWN